VNERAGEEPLLDRVGELRAGVAGSPGIEAQREKAWCEQARDAMHILSGFQAIPVR